MDVTSTGARVHPAGTSTCRPTAATFLVNTTAPFAKRLFASLSAKPPFARHPSAKRLFASRFAQRRFASRFARRLCISRFARRLCISRFARRPCTTSAGLMAAMISTCMHRIGPDIANEAGRAASRSRLSRSNQNAGQEFLLPGVFAFFAWASPASIRISINKN